jgi:hypothetical protein
MAKNTAIGSRTKHVDVRYRFVNDMVLAKELSIDHIRSGENPSDCMTKNLPLSLFAKHAALICEGHLGRLHESTNTEDVRTYCATVGLVDDVTVPRDNSASSEATCSIESWSRNDRFDDLGWTVVDRSPNKPKIKRSTKP